MIKLDIGKQGKLKGKPCISINSEKVNSKGAVTLLIEDIVSLQINKLSIDSGKLKDNPFLVEALRELAGAKYNIEIFTNSDDDIFSLRSFQNINFNIRTILPTKESNNINMSTLGMLKETDCLIFQVKDISEIKSIVDFINERKILKPEIFLLLNNYVYQNMGEVLNILKDYQVYKFNIDILSTN